MNMMQSFLRTVYFIKKYFLLLLYRVKGMKVLSRKQFITDIPKVKSLEIGPFASPCLSGSQVDYFDVLDQQALQKRAIDLSLDAAGCPYIKYVSPNGDLSVVSESYRIVFSSHCIEHQPDLIRHLQLVEHLLEDHGFYYLVIPDKRYCMDAFLPESGISEVLQAFEENRKLHTLRRVIEHHGLTTHNMAWMHWLGIHGSKQSDPERIRLAYDEYKAKKGAYIDVHAWQFTPSSFTGIIDALRQLKFIHFHVEKVSQTRPGSIEFYAVLKKGPRL
jgi:hypothetical protein